MLRIRFFGHLKLDWCGTPHPFAALPKTLPLFAFLLLNRGTDLQRDMVAAQLWPDVTEKTARGNLRRHLYELRRVLPEPPAGTPWILSSQNHLQWNAASPFTLDVAEFQAALQQDDLENAVAQYAQDLLPELYDEWLMPVRDSLQRDYLAALEKLVTICSENGSRQDALTYAKKILQHDDLREDIVRTIMRLQFELADRAGAIQTYGEFADKLREDLGVEPMMATTDLYDQMMGKVDSAIREAFPLPAPLTTFIGREQDITELTNLLCQKDSADRLWTLTGPGGSGKTRLALEVARTILAAQPACFPDGICFVDLSAIVEAEQLPATIARSLGVDVESVQDFRDSVIQAISNRRILLILDNFEQIIEAAPLPVKLLSSAPNLRILVTSRAVLNVYGEREFSVAPLPLPPPSERGRPDDNETYAAIALFVARAQAIQPDFQLTTQNRILIREICERLDGLPLAIEIAAARLRYFTVAEIHAGLTEALTFFTTNNRSLPQRQKTIRDAIEWSYALLSDEEKELFAILSLFDGSISLLAVEDLRGKQSRELLNRLADQNLLVPVSSVHTSRDSTRRWRLLNTIRDLGKEKFSQLPGQEHWVQRFIDYYGNLVATASQNDLASQGSRHREKLSREHENIWAALNLARRAKMPELAIQTANRMAPLWIREGYLVEARQFYDTILAEIETFAIWQNLAMAWRIQGNLNLKMGEFTRARPIYERAQALYEAHGDEAGLLVVLINLGVIAHSLQDLPEALKRNHEALALARRLQYDGLTASILQNLSTIYIRPSGDLVLAEQYANEALALYRKLDNQDGVAAVLNNAGLIAEMRGDLDEAAALLAESLQIREAQGFLLKTAQSQCNLAFVLYKLGQLSAASKFYHQSLSARRKLSYLPGILECLRGLAFLAAVTDPGLGLEAYTAVENQRVLANIEQDEINVPDFIAWEKSMKQRLTAAEFSARSRAGRMHSLEDLFIMLEEA